MSELIKTQDMRTTIQRNLLTTVSAFAIIGYVAGADVASAEDADHPTVWIEFGGQLERASGGDHAYSPSFFDFLAPSITSPDKIADGLPMGFGPEGKISFQPRGSDFTFSVGVRYGRSLSHRSTNEQANLGTFTNEIRHYSYPHHTSTCCRTYQVKPDGDYADVQARHEENHFVLDFRAEKDVGLGLFGRRGTSTVSAGVRFAQFATKSELKAKARGDTQAYNKYDRYAGYLIFPQKYAVATKHRAFSVTATSARSFSGLGPTVVWDASATLLGHADSSELTFDWSINAAVLFGKQKAKTNHQSSGLYDAGGASTSYNNTPVHLTRSRNVVVPNVGGMAGFSIRFPNAKVSMGYRADVFFGAMDSGWDTRSTQNRSFYGPFASVSIGLGG